MQAEENLFKSGIDGFMYLSLYFVIPISELIAYLIVDPTMFFSTMFLLLVSLAYDSYTRYDSEFKYAKKNKKVKFIGILSLSLLLLTAGCWIVELNGVLIPLYIRLIYLIFLFYPLIRAVIDTYLVFKKD